MAWIMRGRFRLGLSGADKQSLKPKENDMTFKHELLAALAITAMMMVAHTLIGVYG